MFDDPMTAALAQTATAFFLTQNLSYCVGFALDYAFNEMTKSDQELESKAYNFTYNGTCAAMLAGALVGGMILLPVYDIAYEEAVLSAKDEKTGEYRWLAADRAWRDSLERAKPVPRETPHIFKPYKSIDLQDNFMSEQRLPTNYVVPRLTPQ